MTYWLARTTQTLSSIERSLKLLLETVVRGYCVLRRGCLRQLCLTLLTFGWAPECVSLCSKFITRRMQGQSLFFLLCSFFFNCKICFTFGFVYKYFLLCVCSHACGYPYRPGEANSMELELQAAVSCCPIWVVGSELTSSARVANTPSRPSSPAWLSLCLAPATILGFPSQN